MQSNQTKAGYQLDKSSKGFTASNQHGHMKEEVLIYIFILYLYVF